MKFKYIKRVFAAVLVTAILLNTCACQLMGSNSMEPMEIEEVYALSFEASGGKDVMPVSGYYGPSDHRISVDGITLPDMVTDEVFQKLSECGINLFYTIDGDHSRAPEVAQKVLDLGAKYNIGICVDDEVLRYRTEDNVKEVAERISLYQDHPGFAGVFIVDEPGTESYRADVGESRYVHRYKAVMQNLGELGVFAAVNHLTPTDDQREAVKDYLDYFCTEFDPMMLSWDYYVFDKDHNRDRWFYSIDVFAEYADKYKIPQWVAVQAGGQWNDGMSYFKSQPYFPTEGELHWNVNVLLASGVKGLIWFPVTQPSWFAYSVGESEWDFQRNGLIGAAGNKTQWWYYAKNINKQLQAVDHVLMNSVCKGVIATGEQAAEDMKSCSYLPMEGTSWRELADVKGSAYIGCFNYQGKTALYVVNYETAYAQKITLNLKDSYGMTVIKEAKETHTTANKITFDMKAGEGVLIVFD